MTLSQKSAPALLSRRARLLRLDCFVRLAAPLAVLLSAGALKAADPASAAPGRHVLVVVWDGMRPDFVTPELTPNLWALAESGVRFEHHHPVYLSSTEVNGTAMATGAYPSHSFVLANVDFRPQIDPQKGIAIEALASIRKGDAVSGGRYLGRPTVAEILHAAGLRTVIAGSKPIALLHDRALRPDSPASSPMLYEGSTLPESLGAGLVSALGPFPDLQPDEDKVARDAWTTGALVRELWRDAVPAYSLLWLAEPDISQHHAGPGSPQALAGIRSSDRNLGRVLAELNRRGLRASTDVFVVSDHGFSTVGNRVDVATDLSLAGFDAARAAPGGLRPGQVLVINDTGTDLIYVGGHDPDLCRRLAAYLQVQDWTGVVFSRVPAEGTFALAEAHLDSPGAPDLVVSMRWTADRAPNGTPGLQTSDLPPANRRGNHSSLSAYDMHNTLIAAGPDLRAGVVDALPSGNTDLAPTILWILGLREAVGGMDGRVLSEALVGGGPALRSYETTRLVARRRTAGALWEQYMRVSEVNGVRYIDEGNGALRAP